MQNSYCDCFSYLITHEYEKYYLADHQNEQISF